MSDLISVATQPYTTWFTQPESTAPTKIKPYPLPTQLTDQVAKDGNGRLFLRQQPALTLCTAASCLVQPQVGDLVSAVIHQQQVFVTAILQRQQAETPLVLNSGEVPMYFQAPAMEIHSTDRIAIHTRRFSLFTHTSMWVAKTLHQVADALFTRAKHAHRQVENTDEVHAKHISQQAEQSLIINSRIGSLNASAVLKIDGGQIHMG